MSPRFAVRRLGAVCVAAALMAGCSSVASTDDTSFKVTTDLAEVEVTGKAGEKPSLDVKEPFSATDTSRRMLTTGKGKPLTAGQRITIDYVGVNGTDAKEFDTSYGKSGRATFTLDDRSILKGMAQGLLGVTVGSRVLLAIPPKDGYETAGAPDAGIGPTDTLLFVIDVKSASAVLKRAAGTTVKPKAGLPKVSLKKKTGEPKITIPSSKPPAELVIQPLITSKGAKVIKGQTITVHYTAMNWTGSKVFDSTWTSGAPASMVIGIGRVIAGLDEGLVGQRVGSQILLVVPPDKGYGVTGKPDGGVKATDTLVFVVDILDATSA